MNRTARRTRPTLASLAKANEALVETNHTLLDILNAVLADRGGKVVIPSIEIRGRTRHEVDVVIHADKGYTSIELRGYLATNPRGVLQRLGLAMPGRS